MHNGVVATKDSGVLTTDRPSLAVLPFAAEASDGRRYFSDGVTEDIVTELSRFRELAVVCASSSFGFEPSTEDPARIAQVLDVRYILRGSIRRATNQVRITGQLLDATSGRQIWADRYHGSIENLLDLQAEIAARIAASIVGEIEWSELGHAHGHQTTNAAAYDLALRAGALLATHVAPTDARRLTEAIRLAEEAVSVDPRCQRALRVLAMAHCRRGVIDGIGESGASDLAAADAAAHRLRELDPSDHTAYAILGHVAMRQLRHDHAISNLRHAHELNPNDVTTLRWLSWEESNLGLVAHARAHAQLALRLGPRERTIDLTHWTLALAEYVGGNLKQCLDHAREAIALNPQFIGHRILLAACLAESGRAVEARTHAAEIRRLAPGVLESRLDGRTYFVDPATTERYRRALQFAVSPERLAVPAKAATDLTAREAEILQLVAAGLSNPRIASRLALSEHTVKRHIANILTKLELPTRAAAVAEAARLGMLGPRKREM
jgi:TolB-like protein/DNA-binding CsgD family transcriptional regulator